MKVVDTFLLEQRSADFNGSAETVPVPGVERPTRLTHLAYVKRGNPVAVWREPVTPSQERAKSAAGIRRLKKRRPARRKARGNHNPPDSVPWRNPKGCRREPGDRPRVRRKGTETERKS